MPKMVLKFPTEQNIDFGHIVQWLFSSSNLASSSSQTLLPIVTLCFCFIIFPSDNDRCVVSESQFIPITKVFNTGGPLIGRKNGSIFLTNSLIRTINKVAVL